MSTMHRVLGVLSLLFLCSEVLGHSYLTNPISRSNQKQTQTGCRGPACLGPCDVTLANARTPAVTIARGATITAQWPRNNHAGGFIRFAWASTSNSDSASAFDAGVQEIHCHEIGGCKPSNPSDPNGGDTGPADGSVNPCQTTIKVPTYLTDGKWTLQWAWFGGAFALGDYYSCVDYVVSGGVAVTSQNPAVFYGGDYTYPGQNKCKFFNTDRLHQCVNEPCNNPVYPGGEQSGPAFGVASSASSTTTTSSTTARGTSTSTSTTARGTTGSSTTTTSTSTTARGTTGTTTSTSSTTGRRTSTTTTSTTGRLATSTTGVANTPPVSPDTCVVGHSRCSGTSTFQTCVSTSSSTNGWTADRPCAAGLVCKSFMTDFVMCDYS